MDRIVLDLLKFYQKEMAETKKAASVIKSLGITNEAVTFFQLAYSTGAAFTVAGKEQRKKLRALDLAGNMGDRFKGCVIIPIHNETGTLVDLHGLRLLRGQVKRICWKNPSQGIIGIAAVATHPEIILTDTPLYGLQIMGYGYPNVVALRHPDEMKILCPLLSKHDTRRVYILSRSRFELLQEALKPTGVDIVKLPSPKPRVEKRHLEVVGTLPLQPEECTIKLIEKNDSRLVFDAEGVRYRLDSMLLSGMGMKVQIRAELEKQSFRDKVDLASFTQRKGFCRACGMRMGISAARIENHLSRIADMIDELLLSAAEAKTQTVRPLKPGEQETALSVLRSENMLDYLSRAMEEKLHFIGEESNRKLALLIAASRLLEKPLGGMIRGEAGCGKSELIRCVTRVLPMTDVLYFSRMTGQSLFFMPRDQLQNKLLVVDEYEGMQESEYAVRTMMSSQTLSLAITLREGGRVPVTKTVEIPATVAILVSTTGVINAENLSRFIELRMDSGAEQNERVIRALAKKTAGSPGNLRELQNLSQMLKPCRALIPYADKLIYKSANVLARRQFTQVVGLISAHAALHQYQREVEDNEVIATKEDYAAVYPLLASVVDHFEENLTPASVKLLEVLQKKKAAALTRKQVMEWMGWPYSRAYTVLQELSRVDLLIADNLTNGIERNYEIAPYFQTSGGIGHIAPPETI